MTLLPAMMRKPQANIIKSRPDSVMKESHRSALIHLVKDEFPAACGVYLFFDSVGCVLYVGKSVNIKNRVLSHLRQKTDEGFLWKGILPDHTSDVEYIITNDELIALLIEDKLIKHHKPLYNIRQKHFQKYKYLGMTSGLFPGIKIYGHSLQIRNRLIFGPFKNRLHIDLLIKLIQRYFRLRICNDLSPLQKCVYHDIELCRGPCTVNILPFEYTATVNDVIHFLNGNTNGILRELRKDLDVSISGLEFERAESTRKMIDFCMEYSKKQLYQTLFKNKMLKIYSKISGEVKYSFKQGRIIYFAYDADAFSMNSRVIEPVHQSFFDPRILLDRSDIIYNWLNRHMSEFDYHFC